MSFENVERRIALSQCLIVMSSSCSRCIGDPQQCDTTSQHIVWECRVSYRIVARRIALSRVVSQCRASRVAQMQDTTHDNAIWHSDIAIWHCDIAIRRTTFSNDIATYRAKIVNSTHDISFENVECRIALSSVVSHCRVSYRIVAISYRNAACRFCGATDDIRHGTNMIRYISASCKTQQHALAHHWWVYTCRSYDKPKQTWYRSTCKLRKRMSEIIIDQNKNKAGLTNRKKYCVTLKNNRKIEPSYFRSYVFSN